MQPTLTLENLLQQDSELSSLPEIYIRVSELLDDDNVTAMQIGQVVETDPALSSRILKMVNSAYYGFPNQISGISQAITILGRERLKQILIGSVLGGVFGKFKNPVFSMEDYWYHSVKTAILARQLCRNSAINEEAETLFTAGLLHDIGRLILAQKMPELSAEVQSAVDHNDADLIASERQAFGFTHCDTGAAFIQKWGLPDILSAVAEYHHQSATADRYADEVRLIYMANNLVFMVSPVDNQEVKFALEDIPGWEESGLSVSQIAEACELADDQVYDVMASLGMVQMRIDLDDE